MQLTEKIEQAVESQLGGELFLMAIISGEGDVKKTSENYSTLKAAFCSLLEADRIILKKRI